MLKSYDYELKDGTKFNLTCYLFDSGCVNIHWSSIKCTIENNKEKTIKRGSIKDMEELFYKILKKINNSGGKITSIYISDIQFTRFIKFGAKYVDYTVYRHFYTNRTDYQIKRR